MLLCCSLFLSFFLSFFLSNSLFFGWFAVAYTIVFPVPVCARMLAVFPPPATKKSHFNVPAFENPMHIKQERGAGCVTHTMERVRCEIFSEISSLHCDGINRSSLSMSLPVFLHLSINVFSLCLSSISHSIPAPPLSPCCSFPMCTFESVSLFLCVVCLVGFCGCRLCLVFVCLCCGRCRFGPFFLLLCSYAL